jgi:diphosphomevalonate decarboxylase
MKAVAVAHPNIALSKYWGKQRTPGNYPAVPSISITLAGLATRTEVEVVPDLVSHTVSLLGGVAARAPGASPLDPTAGGSRAETLLETVRAASKEKGFARVATENDFPTASGLASSASGFAALAVAAVKAYGLDWDDAQVSDLARQASASAARSVFGGFVELESPPATEGMLLAAKPLAPADHLDVRMIVCVTTNAPKRTSSTEGMIQTAEKSPYYRAWLETAPRLFSEMRAALLAKDLEKLGDLMEQSSFAMHACALASGVSYISAATLDVLDAVRELRRAGKGAWSTMDAGPHVKVLVPARDAEAAAAVLGAVPGVIRVIVAKPGPGPRAEVI